MTKKLENLLSFDDFGSNWKAKEQKSTKRTEVGLDIMNENIYMKVMDQESKDWKTNMDKFIDYILKAIKDNQVKNVSFEDGVVDFTIRGRKFKVDKDNGSIGLFRTKATTFRESKPDSAGRVRQEKKRKKTSEEIQVKLPYSKTALASIYSQLKEKYEEDED